jgi:hypothetical protein
MGIVSTHRESMIGVYTVEDEAKSLYISLTSKCCTDSATDMF